MTLDLDRLARLDSFLIDLNRASAAAILPLFRADHGLEDKSLTAGPDAVFDPVTEADKSAERAIRAMIEAAFPDHGIIGEEYGEDRPEAEFVWVLDPVDGTRAFIAGLPLWTTLIGLRHQGQPVLGSIGQPYIGELFIGHPGASRLISRGGETPLRVRACPNLTDAIICTTDPAILTESELGAWTQVRSAARLARLGLDAYGYAMVAMGRMDLALDTGLKVWDVEAVIPVIQGAGGVVTHWDGAPARTDGGQFAFAGDPACLEAALVSLRRSAS
ncbi:MAG: histidinol-phosphatase [Caulobacter sp.]|jgi:histidinol phosphatase-like enzyme (inositol monophosphatase family)|nr:histidinol-phosphatase [Caulobacter sp.]